ncbi:unnamed protein product [Vitrella brassicaformis CCMP3155]|uniref:Uncharacterized protein n=1 Tax=Vitrella brassicaformis (strain CCMP3155) TaxID=1169540 RepID=A0A0G4EUZ3_VITBC|nr:unnamed protein product [Vitrella brassicaformis CCMP3155]|eukprot:CEM02421.1 unnamed protein product [Vitrella brassicaformis CCMP3155]
MTLDHLERIAHKNIDTTLGHILRPKVPEILRFIEEIAQKISTYIIRGNHDYETLTRDFVKKHMPSVHYRKDVLVDWRLVRLEHGQFEDLLNRPGPLSDYTNKTKSSGVREVVSQLPVGFSQRPSAAYWLARADATRCELERFHKVYNPSSNAVRETTELVTSITEYILGKHFKKAYMTMFQERLQAVTENGAPGQDLVKILNNDVREDQFHLRKGTITIKTVVREYGDLPKVMKREL